MPSIVKTKTLQSQNRRSQKCKKIPQQIKLKNLRKLRKARTGTNKMTRNKAKKRNAQALTWFNGEAGLIRVCTQHRTATSLFTTNQPTKQLDRSSMSRTVLLFQSYWKLTDKCWRKESRLMVALQRASPEHGAQVTRHTKLWSIVGLSRAYRLATTMCSLCQLTEKFTPGETTHTARLDLTVHWRTITNTKRKAGFMCTRRYLFSRPRTIQNFKRQK